MNQNLSPVKRAGKPVGRSRSFKLKERLAAVHLLGRRGEHYDNSNNKQPDPGLQRGRDDYRDLTAAIAADNDGTFSRSIGKQWRPASAAK